MYSGGGRLRGKKALGFLVGDIEKGIKGSIPSDECCVAYEGVFEKGRSIRFGSRLCERVQFLDA